MEISIIELCNNLNKAIHDPLFHNFYNLPDELKYHQTFTSIDLIEDSQIAINEFEKIDTNGVKGRSTLLKYGLLQSFFLQQDGLFHLYKCIIENNIKLKDFFDLFSFDIEIRNVRNDIAGHPTNRNNSEYYFIAKGTTAKYRFTYAGYTPEFREVKVDLKIFISKQIVFVKRVLLFVQNDIKKKIEMKKEEYKKVKLSEMINGVGRMQLISRGIDDYNRSVQGKIGILGIRESIEKIGKELDVRYNGNLPNSISEAFRLINYILYKFDRWQKQNQLLDNDDAEIFLDSLCNQLNKLEEMLKEIDEEFNN